MRRASSSVLPPRRRAASAKLVCSRSVAGGMVIGFPRIGAGRSAPGAKPFSILFQVGQRTRKRRHPQWAAGQLAVGKRRAERAIGQLGLGNSRKINARKGDARLQMKKISHRKRISVLTFPYRTVDRGGRNLPIRRLPKFRCREKVWRVDTGNFLPHDRELSKLCRKKWASKPTSSASERFTFLCLPLGLVSRFGKGSQIDFYLEGCR